jgi:hypothetical protein
MLERITREGDPKYNEASIEVVSVRYLDFQSIKRKYSNAFVIEDGWEEVESDVPVLNEGAASCLIIYVKDLTTGFMLPGHFPATDRRGYVRFVQKNLVRIEEAWRKEDPGVLKVHLAEELERLVEFSLEEYKRYLAQWLK